ncbi:hypothetical protein [Oceanicoccus sp. KOV_DT_Chl]|uniref:YhdP family protein n=1 Tax=Oceanicoccus sp. KOV_DT_Chl TaxID=1904639 RepID=UPI000C7B49DB|nr:hypothetical protein [Oceanicoccus sp. KOV_DT_Chl]
MLKQGAIIINRVLWTVIVTLLVLFALYISVGRYYIRYVEDYQQQLVAEFVDITGLPVTVARLYGEWSKLSPVLTMESVVLAAPEDRQQAVLVIENFSVQLDLIDSLLSRSIQIRKLLINDARVSLLEDSPGHWGLQGYGTGDRGVETTIDLDNLIDLLLTVEDAELVKTEIKLRYEDEGESALVINELSLNRDQNFRRMRLQLLMDESAKPVVAIVEASGDPREQDVFSAKAYINLDQLDFKSKLPLLQGLGIDLQEAAVNSELWLDWQPNTEILLQGYIDIPFVDIAAFSGESLAPLENFELAFRAEKSGSSWQGWIPKLSTQWQQQHFEFENIQFAASPGEQSISMPEFNVEQGMQQLLALDLLGEKIKETLSTLALTGMLENIRLRMETAVAVKENSRKVLRQVKPTEKKLAEKFQVQANLLNIGLAPWKGARVPAMSVVM